MSSCMQKWKTYPEEYAGYVSDLLQASSSYMELVEKIKELEGEQFGEENEVYITQDDIIYLLAKAKKSTDLLESLEQFTNLDRAYKNISSIFGNNSSAIVLDEKAKLLPDQTDKLIPILNADLNVLVEHRLKNYAFHLTTYDPSVGLKGQESLDFSIRDYKNGLFNILQRYLGYPNLMALYDNESGEIDYELYYKVMEEVWEKMKGQMSQTSHLYEGFRNDPKTSHFLQVAEAFYILQNFDTFMQNYSNGLIAIDENKFGSTEVSNEKYKLREQHKVNTSFDSDHSDHDSDKQTSKIFASYWESIQLPDGSFLTMKDFKKLVEYIKNVINEGSNSEWDFLIENNPQLQNGKRIIDLKIIHQLRHDKPLHRFLGPDGETICRAVADRFELFVGKEGQPGHYQEYLEENSLNVAEKAYLESNRHFLIQFRNEVINRENRAQTSYSEDKTIKTVSDARLAQSKQMITSRIEKSLLDHVEAFDFGIYSPTLLIDRHGVNIFSDKFVQFVNELTGLRLSTTQLERFAQNAESIQTLLDFLDGFIELVQSDLIAPLRYKTVVNKTRDTNEEHQIVERFMKKLKVDPRYMDFSNLYIKQNRNDVTKVLDQGGNPQPIQISPSTITQYKKNLKEYIQQHSVKTGGDVMNVLARFPQLTSPEKYHKTGLTSSNVRYGEHIVYRQDCAYTDDWGTKVIKASQMSPDETLTMAFCGEFFDAIVNHGTFYNQVDCYSDKVTIALAAYNMLAEVDFKGQLRPFVNLKSNELFEIWGQQRCDYYQTVASQIVKDLTLLFGPAFEGKSFDELVSEVEKYTAEEFEKKVAAYNKNNPSRHINIVKEIHYTGKGEKPCKFNATLYFNIKETQNGVGKYLQRYYNEGLQEFISQLESIVIPKKYRTVDFIDNNKGVLCDLFGLSSDVDSQILYDYFKVPTGSESLDTMEDIFWVQYEFDEAGRVKKDSKGNKILTKQSEELIKKYFALQAISADAELQITSKENVIHENKEKIDESLQRGISSYTSDPEAFYNFVKLEQSGRLINGKKRNNSEVASYLPMETTSKYGVSTHSNVAIVYSKKQDLQNYNGQVNNGQDVVDGSLQTLGIAVVWERHSYPTKTIGSTKKVIGLIPSLTTMSQYKCADFALDNLYILNSHNNSDEHTTNVRVRARKMMEQGVFSDAFYQAYSNVEELPSIGVNVSKYFGPHLCSLARVECIDPKNKVMRFYWQNAEADSNASTFYDERIINNAYDLWEALGAEHTVEEKDGVWVPSNGSMEYIAYAISEHDPIVKERIVSKIVDVSANKSGITNINLLEDVDTDDSGFTPEKKLPLNTTRIDNSRWGMQQDYGHISDESSIPSLSQVISAVAFNGKNIKIVGDMYETLATLTLLKAKELGITFQYGQNPQAEFNFHYKLVEQLTRSLETGATRSDALTLTRETKEVLDRLIEENKQNLALRKEDGSILPFSSPDIFYKLASDFISKLNKKSIRQTFNGIAIIQNPSHSNIAIYEDNQGKTYKKFDLLQIGRTQYKNDITPYFTEKEIIQVVLSKDPRFAPKYNVNPNELELEDWVSFTIEGLDDFGDPIDITKEVRIVHPKQLFDFADGIYKETNVHGDEITFKIKSGITKLYGRSRDLKVPNVHFYTALDENGKPVGYQSLWLTEAIKERAFYQERKDSAERKKAIQWQRANLEGLGSSQPYIYKTKSDFESGIKTFVYGVTFTPGEQIIPKVNKSAQGLGSYSLSEIEQMGDKYFVAQMEHNFERVNPLSVYAPDGTITYTSSKEQSLLSVVRTKDEIMYAQFLHPNVKRSFQNIDNPNIIQKDGQYYFQNDNLEILFAVPSRNSRIYTQTIADKKVYYVYDESASNQTLEYSILNTEDINALYVDSQVNVVNYHELQTMVNTTIDTTKSKDQIKKAIREQAKQMYESFKLSNYTISARIPSQSFQSFMPNKTVAFMDSDMNDGYINIFEIWFQGSDYDIDKAYTMMYELDKSGIIAGISPIKDLTSHATFAKSLQLPLPDPSKRITEFGDNDISGELLAVINKYSKTGQETSLKGAYSWIAQMATSNDEQQRLTYLNLMNDLLTVVKNSKGSLYVGIDQLGNLVNLINAHNSYKVTAAGLKNRVMNIIYHCAQDVKNLEASSQPMEMKAIKDLIKEIEDERGTPKKVYNNINPYTKFAIQYENSVGKKNVGIAANGVKGAAAIQQHFNEYYQNWDPTTPIDPSYSIDMELKFHETVEIDGQVGIRDIYTDHICHVGDVVLTGDQHKVLVSQTKWYESSEYYAMRHLINENGQPINPNSIVDTSGGIPMITNFKNKKGELKSQYQDLLSAWQLFRPNGFQTNAYGQMETLQSVWIDFMYFKRQFNANVADMISIFISLATDNAKELVLARIKASPELMSIPITMLTLGIPPKQVLDVCITCLDPIYQKLQRNRLQNPGSGNVRNLIRDATEFDTVTKESLLKVYDAAQEMRAITSFFKINQGLTAQYVELLGFYKNLSAVLPQMVQRKNGKVGDVLPLDLHLLFSAEKKGTDEYNEYLENQLNLMNQTRSAFNVLDIVTKNKNFSAMLEAMETDLTSIQYAAGVAKFVSIKSIINSERTEQLTSNDYRSLIRVYQDFIIAKVLQSDSFIDFKFTVESLSRQFGLTSSELNLPYNQGQEFGIDTADGVKNFIHIIENVVIPRLKTLYPNNFFIQSLTEEFNKQLNKNVYVLNYDVFDDTDVAEQQNIQNAILDLRMIADYNSGLSTIYGQPIKIGDLFLLYDAIVHKQKMSGLNMAVKSVANASHSQFAKVITDMYVEYDEKSRNPKMQEELLEEFKSLDIIQEAALRGKMSAESSSGESVNLIGEYIWAFAPVAKRKYSISEVVKEYEASGIIKAYEINSREENGREVLTLLIHTNYRTIPYTEVKKLPLNRQATLEDFAGSDENIKKLQTMLAFETAFEKSKRNQGTKRVEIDTLVNQAETLKVGQILKKAHALTGIELEEMTNPKEGLLSNPIYGYIQVLPSGKKIIVLPEYVSDYQILDLLLEAAVGTDKTAKLLKLKELTQNVERPKTIQTAYLSHLAGIYPGKEIVQKCLVAEEQVMTYLQEDYLYYREFVQSEKNVVDKAEMLSVGDLVKFNGQSGVSFKDEFMYVGIIQGNHVFKNVTLRVDGTTSSQIRQIPVDDASLLGAVLSRKLRVPFGYVAKARPFVDSGSSYMFGKCTIQSGDMLILTDGTEAVVCKPVYDITEDGTYKEQYIAQVNGYTVNINESHIKYVKKNKFNTLDFSTSFHRYEIRSDFAKSRDLIKKLQPGDIVELSNGSEVTFEGFVNSTSFKASGGIFNQSDIKAIKSAIVKYSDLDFEHDISPLEIFADQHTINFIQNYKGFRLATISRGYGAADTKDQQFVKGNKKVYNMREYMQVNTNITNKGDMFIVYSQPKDKNEVQNASAFYKILDIKQGVYEVLSQEGDVQTIVYLTKSELQSKVYGAIHYSKEQSIVPDPNVIQAYELSDRLKGIEVIKHLQEQFGLKLQFAEFKNENTNAKVYNDTIYINIKFKNNSEQILNLALHEFTHLSIAMLRLKDPDTYVSMISSFQEMVNSGNIPAELKSIFHDIDEDMDTYKTQADKNEEKIVRFLDYFRTHSTQIETISALNDYINKGFATLFGANISNVSWTRSETSAQSLRWIMEKYNNGELFKDVPSGLNFLELKKREKRKHLLNDIIEKCY